MQESARILVPAADNAAPNPDEERRYKLVWVFLVIAVILLIVSYLGVTFGEGRRHIIALATAAVPVTVTLSLSLHLLLQHLDELRWDSTEATARENDQGQDRQSLTATTHCTVGSAEERCITIRLILLVPMYGFNAFVGLGYPHYAAEVLAHVSEFYEAVAAFSLLQLVFRFACDATVLKGKLPEDRNLSAESTELTGRRVLQRLWPDLCQGHVTGGHRFASCLVCGPVVKPGFVTFVHRALTVYGAVSVILLIATCVTIGCGLYDTGLISPRNAYVYIKLARTVVVIPSIVSLLLVVIVSHDFVPYRRPWTKFRTVKGVIAITVWQTFAIGQLAEHVGLFGRTGEDELLKDNVGDFPAFVNAFCFCFEMLPFAMLNLAVFPAVSDDWASKKTSGAVPQRSMSSGLRLFLSGTGIVQSYREAWRD